MDSGLKKISFDPYISREYVQWERERLWPQVWQIACREEEIASPGDYVTYDIADSSVIVVRTREGEIAAHHNVCLHRGRRLVSDCGNAKIFHCGYHGWNYDLDGRNMYVQDPEDWMGALDRSELRLKSVRVACWAGFVWVDMRSEGESLMEYLETLPEVLGPYEYDKMRYRWYVTLHLPCNWKVAMEAFMEGYHVAATHPQILSFMGDDRTLNNTYGKHSSVTYGHTGIPLGMPAPRLKQQCPNDARTAVIHFFEYYEQNLKAQFSDRNTKAVSQQLLEKVPKDADVATAFLTAVDLGRKAAEADGAGWPETLTFQHMFKTGAVLHGFPNFATLPWFDAALCYRARPRGDDPDHCIFDIWSLVRYAPGKEPPLKRILVTGPPWETVPFILTQDISNMGEVQKGMKTRAITEGFPNPVQEATVINFHRNLARYIGH